MSEDKLWCLVDSEIKPFYVFAGVNVDMVAQLAILFLKIYPMAILTTVSIPADLPL
jgi:hypothetical protein